MDENEKKKQIMYWLKNREPAYSEGKAKEIRRINKILSFYSYDARASASAA
ncbi:MAG: hypothetical protein KAI53_01590 [Candidatus Aenigmarchaeota archaeon]|nr:hypothetical protein [Candidatus Aenigmarchaeota archaeon]